MDGIMSSQSTASSAECLIDIGVRMFYDEESYLYFIEHIL